MRIDEMMAFSTLVKDIPSLYSPYSEHLFASRSYAGFPNKQFPIYVSAETF